MVFVSVSGVVPLAFGGGSESNRDRNRVNLLASPSEARYSDRVGVVVPSSVDRIATSGSCAGGGGAIEADETKSRTWAGVRYVDGPGSGFACGGMGSVGGGSEAVCMVARVSRVSLAFRRLDSPSLLARSLAKVGAIGRRCLSVASPACRSAVWRASGALMMTDWTRDPTSFRGTRRRGEGLRWSCDCFDCLVSLPVSSRTSCSRVKVKAQSQARRRRGRSARAKRNARVRIRWSSRQAAKCSQVLPVLGCSAVKRFQPS